MTTKRILNIIALAKKYSKLPSELIHVCDEYTAFCFDEACAIIANRIESGEEPQFVVKYRSFTELYDDVLKGRR